VYIDESLNHVYIPSLQKTHPKVQIFWFNIFNLISKILKVQLKPNPLIIILGISDEINRLNNYQQCLLSYSLITAKKLLLMHWKNKEIPTTKLWLSDLTNTLYLERMKYILMDKLL